MSADQIPLAKAIEGLRAEFEAAAKEGEGKEVGFEATTVSVTLETSVSNTGGANAGVRWWLIEAGANASRESGATQSVTITLTPHRRRADGTKSPMDLEAGE